MHRVWTHSSTPLHALLSTLPTQRTLTMSRGPMLVVIEVFTVVSEVRPAMSPNNINLSRTSSFILFFVFCFLFFVFRFLFFLPGI